MKTSSAKAKGRRLQDFVVKELQDWFGWNEHQVKPAIMGESGTDIKLGWEQMQQFPWDVECKNVEKLNIWSALKQAEANAGPGRKPLLVFTRNRTPTYVAMRWEDFKKQQ